MPLVGGECSKCTTGITAITAVFISGCSGSPSFSLLGYLLLRRLQADHLMTPSAVAYPALVAFLSLAVWLMLFQR
jgi:hypothetical protein